MPDLLVSSDYYAATHPTAYADAEETAERAKVARKKGQRLDTARAAADATATAAAAGSAPALADGSASTL